MLSPVSKIRVFVLLLYEKEIDFFVLLLYEKKSWLWIEVDCPQLEGRIWKRKLWRKFQMESEKKMVELATVEENSWI